MSGTGYAILKRIGLIVGLIAVLIIAANAQSPKQRRDRLVKAHRDGNYKVAYEGVRKLALDPKADPKQVGDDLDLAIHCLNALGRTDEIDDFREAVIAVHAKNWRLLHHAAASFSRHGQFGQTVAGRFRRASERGPNNFISSVERDRVRAMQLYAQALVVAENGSDKTLLARLHMDFARTVLNGDAQPVSWTAEKVKPGSVVTERSLDLIPRESWRLQYLTDLSKLPDYDEDNDDGSRCGAPVDENDKPLFYLVPKSFAAATNDGERWRWLLARTIELDPSLANEVDWSLATFFRSQFGVWTTSLSQHYRDEETADRITGPFDFRALKDTETIANLANGLKRFSLPDEFNWIRIYERIIRRGKSDYGGKARDALAREYEARWQYVKAAAAWRKAIAEYGPGEENWRKTYLDQIIGNWGKFEEVEPQVAGKKAVVHFRFRNGKKVTFQAHSVKVDVLLADVKDSMEKTPGSKAGQQFQIDHIGSQLLQKGEKKYIGNRVAVWSETLKPRDGHLDSHLAITTPLEKPGAYLLTAKMEHGNTTRALVWLADTVLVQKRLNNKVLWFVADALDGKPVADAKMEFFCFGWRPLPGKPNERRVVTASFVHNSDADGQVILNEVKFPRGDDCMIIARKAKDGLGGADRFAHLGFASNWFNRGTSEWKRQGATFVMTDRPVYRPEHKVRFKAWIRRTEYDQADTSEFANKPFKVVIRNPNDEKLFEKQLTTDAYAGLSGEFSLPKDATLGCYHIQVGESWAGSFRVEEYKKPEYEVRVEAPTEHVRLGEKIEAIIQARYYFGVPVTHARVKYKVVRSKHRFTWYPSGAWDWFYGTGYWWFGADYAWYPGWAQWGCRRPLYQWSDGWFQGQPEVVIEDETAIGADGRVKVTIDTRPAKELHPDEDHKYTITAEVVDESRRTIVGTGEVMVSRKPFQVFAWIDRGHYRLGDTVKAEFSALTLDRKPVTGAGELTLYQILYDKANKPVEKAVQTWQLDTDAGGRLSHQLKAAEAGQYRLSYKLTDAKKHTIEGGYIFVIRGDGFEGGKDFRYNDLELITDKREYAPGDKVQLLINTSQQDGTVLLFVRPSNGVYSPPKVVRIKGKSAVEEIAITQKDMPNFFVEAVTVHGGKVHTEIREVIVPPEKRVLNVEVLPSLPEYKPGQKATVKVRLTDFFGKPFSGSAAMTVYDRSVEYIFDGINGPDIQEIFWKIGHGVGVEHLGSSNVPEIKEYFWKWRRHHRPVTVSSLHPPFGQWLVNTSDMVDLASRSFFDELETGSNPPGAQGLGAFGGFGGGALGALGGGGVIGGMAGIAGAQIGGFAFAGVGGRGPVPLGARPAAPPGVEPTVRKNFADTAFWKASLQTNADGIAEVTFPMPEQLTGWKIKVWAMGHGTKVGQGEVVVTTKKDLLLRMQTPRFFMQKDEVVLSANVHNYLKKDKEVAVSLEVEGGTLELIGSALQKVAIAAGGEKRIDWRVKVKAEGEAVVRMKAITDEDSDAMQMRFPSYVHGMLKMDSFSGVIRPDKNSGTITMTVPAERRINQTRLEVRYTPTLAGAMVDALPYLVEYPYGCTEQTLNRFLPTVITQRVLQRMKLDLKDIQQKRTNLNAAELGDDKERAKGWKRYERNAVFDEDEVRKMATAGVQALTNMQCSDGGWGWFSGYGEHSWPHTTAVVVHGLQIAQQNDIALAPNVLQRGVDWLKNYQAEQVHRLLNAATKTIPYKESADNLDALVNMVLVDAGFNSNEMRDFLYRDRTNLAVYAKALFGLALHKQKEGQKLAMILENIEQFVVEDKENQTAYLQLPAGNPWWYWYGSDTEANAYYLKLLSATNPKDKKAAGLVKYLLNNRKHSTYWNSTRDTATCIEAMADYLRASGEDKPDLTVEVFVDGKKEKEVKIDASNLFTFDNKLVLHGDAVETGKHTVEIKKKGTGPVYFNAYLTNFTLEDHITRAGLEVKVNRKYYKLERIKDAKVKVSGARGQAADQKVEKYRRIEMKNLDKLKSGDLVEVELEIDSKNDYEYVLFEDPKAAGCEALLVRSGYNANDMGAYMEMRDDRVCFFVRRLARGKHSVAYRLRAEIPGQFSALPARASAMYAPELKGNSDEIKVVIED